jgi:hypothetical protein
MKLLWKVQTKVSHPMTLVQMACEAVCVFEVLQLGLFMLVAYFPLVMKKCRLTGSPRSLNVYVSISAVRSVDQFSQNTT